jgi:hypothetical protein
MTGSAIPPQGARVPPRSPQSGGRRSGDPVSDEQPAGLAPREEQQLEESVRVVGRTGRGPVIVGVLVAAAFLLGLARPWDLLNAPAPDRGDAAAPDVAIASPAGDSSPGAEDFATPGVLAVAPTRPPTPPARALTCAFPSEWRSASIEDWSARPARVWRAAEVVEASGPDDPTIAFEPIVAATITAIGWCAPVDGPDRPPLGLTASLFRLRDGVAIPVPYDRLEPAQPDALGELWTPVVLGVGNRPPWPFGRYVIELRSGSGSYVRYLGIELLEHVERGAAGSPSPDRSPAASPDGSAAPDG